MSLLNELKKELEYISNPEQAKNFQAFFKTGKGEYGEGDIFLGVCVPVQRKIAKKYNLNLIDIQKLLKSKIHQERFIGLLILIKKFEKGDKKLKKQVFNFYIKNAKNVNNWDLVDISAYKIIGNYLLNQSLNERKILYKLAKSKNLWERRISILTTFAFIKENDFKDTLKISKILLNDEQDLIHKAVGWMLREVGKKNKKILEGFLEKNCKKMPRVMLRYAVEKFSKNLRQTYYKK